MLSRLSIGLRSCNLSASRVGQRGRRTYATQQPEFYDVVCVGGGPAGLSLVGALRASNVTSRLKIALIEGQDLGRHRLEDDSSTEYSNRCSSLTPASVNLFKDIGAWSHINASRIEPYHSMEVWDGVSDSRISFDWASIGMPAARSPGEDPSIVAYMTENANLTTALLKQLKELGGISVMDNTRVSSIELGQETDSLDLRSWPILTLPNGRNLAARLLVGSDGAQSPVRNFAGIKSRGWDYNRHGVVATLRLSEGAWQTQNYRTAYQRFLPTGPVALLPLPGPYASLVWSTMPGHASHLKSLSPEDFLATVNAAFRLRPVDIEYIHTIPSGQASELSWRLQHTSFNASLIPPELEAVQPGSVASFPLRMRHAATYVGERVALVGDAAHTIHPLAGQGLNQGQGDVAALVKVIEKAVQEGADIGSTMSLEAYDTERWAQNNTLLGVVDKLHKLYSVSSGPIVGLRSLGLSAVDKMGWAKGFLMQTAAGVR